MRTDIDAGAKHQVANTVLRGALETSGTGLSYVQSSGILCQASHERFVSVVQGFGTAGGEQLCNLVYENHAG